MVIRVLRCCGAVLGLVMLILPASAQQTGAGTSSILVQGNRRVDAEAVRAAFADGADHKLDAVAIDAGLKKLYATGQFSDVRIATAGGRLVVTVVENPVIGRLAFEGNSKIKDKDLTAHIQSKAREPLSRPVVQQDVAAIVAMYRHIGRFDAQVDPKIITHPDQRVDLVFAIREGAKTGVKTIAFVGNTAFPARVLRDQIKTGQSNVLSFLLNNDLYDPDRVDEDRELLHRFYLKHGYLDARVSAEPRYDPASRTITITFTVAEGEAFRVGDVAVRSQVSGLDAAILRGGARVSTGQPVDVEVVEKSVDAMTMLASRRGYPFVRVAQETERQSDGRTVNLIFTAENGPRVYVERIDIRGNTHTRDYVIRREFDLGEGDAYNRALIDRAERRLKALGYFKSVKIGTDPGSRPDRVIVHVDVEEQETGEFSIAGGYSTTDGILAQVSVGERNLFGTGIAVKAAVTYGQYAKGFDLSLVEPYFLGDRISLGGDVFAKSSIPSSSQSYGSQTYGAGTRLTLPIDDALSVSPHYSLYNQSLSLAPALMGCSAANPVAGCSTVGMASAAIQNAALGGAQWVSVLGNTVGYSTLDNAKNPTSGLSASVTEDLAGLGGGARFVRTTSDLRYYQPVGDDIVAMVRGQTGYVGAWGGQSLPLMSGFFGGPQLVRGFAVNGFGPRDINPDTTMDNIGGSRYWATTAEFDAPVPYLPQSAGLKFGVFADAGSVWGYSGQTTFSGLSQSMLVADGAAIRSSVGASMIWDSPFGPLRVDYAYPLTKAGYDITQRFHFGAGAF